MTPEEALSQQIEIELEAGFHMVLMASEMGLLDEEQGWELFNAWQHQYVFEDMETDGTGEETTSDEIAS